MLAIATLFRALPLVVQLAIGFGITASVGTMVAVWHHKVYRAGYDAALAAVAADNKEAVDAADQARARVRDCNARDGMRWSQSAGECVRRD